jgi:RNA polymerase sigma-70 factor, ECF subfamily
MTAPATAATPARAAGPPPGLREIFDAHHEFVYRSARRLGVPLTIVDDVVQETFIVAGRKLAEFEGRSSIKTWLFGITMRVAHTHRRGEARRQQRAAVVAEGAAALHDPYAQREAADLLHRLLDELDDERRAAFVLADCEGMTAVEIAEGLGVNVNTIYSRIRSARKQIEEALARLQAREGGA